MFVQLCQRKFQNEPFAKHKSSLLSKNAWNETTEEKQEKQKKMVNEIM